MFKCEICKRNSQPYERPVMRVLETRDREYPERPNFYGEDKHDPGGYGTEIVKEIRVHKGCAEIEVEPQPDSRGRIVTVLA